MIVTAKAGRFQKGQGRMAKGYWVAHVDVTEPEGYKAYVGADMEAFRKYGGRFLVRGGQFEVLEGASRSRTV